MGSLFARISRALSQIRLANGRTMRVTQGQAYALYGVVILLIALLIGGFAVARSASSGPPTTSITIDGAHAGAAFQGVGAISGGGGNSRLLIEYPRQQRQQILDYLFKPGYGAALQLLKLEIGGDAYATDGAEPSFEQTKGNINCNAGYEFWLAQQARRLDPRIQIYALQWNAPHWVGGAWSAADIGYLLDYLRCASKDGVPVNYLGGFNEHLPHGITPQVMGWFISLRHALDAAGFGAVKIVAVDSFAHEDGTDVANFLAAHPAFARSISVLGYHNLCRYPATGKTCLIPPAARTAGKAIWESEIGALRQHTGVAAMTRSINNAFIQVRATGLIEWPTMGSEPPFLPEEDRGLVFADQPWSGQYKVNLMSWVIAQTSQFTAPGWRHVNGASGKFGGAYGSYTSYEAPDRSAWSLVAQTADAPDPQTVVVHVAAGLPRATVHVWTTNITSTDPAQWFRHVRDLRPSAGGTFHYRLPKGSIITFTTVAGGGHGTASPPPQARLPMPYRATPDASNEPMYLGAQDGSFEYLPGSSAPGVFEQTTVGQPVFWQNAVTSRFPYAVVGDTTWKNYTVSAQVKFTAANQSAGLIARFWHPRANGVAQQFHGYQFIVSQSGAWKLFRNAVWYKQLRTNPAVTLRTGQLRAPVGVGRWVRLSLTTSGSTITATVNGKVVMSLTDTRWTQGDAGISTGGWYHVLFRDLTVARA
jgi:hypothetical protein